MSNPSIYKKFHELMNSDPDTHGELPPEHNRKQPKRIMYLCKAIEEYIDAKLEEYDERTAY